MWSEAIVNFRSTSFAAIEQVGNLVRNLKKISADTNPSYVARRASMTQLALGPCYDLYSWEPQWAWAKVWKIETLGDIGDISNDGTGTDYLVYLEA